MRPKTLEKFLRAAEAECLYVAEDAIDSAATHGNVRMARIVLDLGFKPRFLGTMLTVSHSLTAVEIARMLLDAGIDPNACAPEDYGDLITTPPLYNALTTGATKLVELLIERGADVNIEAGQYKQPLQAAAGRGHEDVVRVLLEIGADVHYKGGIHGSALQAAVYSGPTGIQELLIGHPPLDALSD